MQYNRAALTFTGGDVAKPSLGSQALQSSRPHETIAGVAREFEDIAKVRCGASSVPIKRDAGIGTRHGWGERGKKYLCIGIHFAVNLFTVIGCTIIGCHYKNMPYDQWLQSWHHVNSRFSEYSRQHRTQSDDKLYNTHQALNPQIRHFFDTGLHYSIYS